LQPRPSLAIDPARFTIRARNSVVECDLHTVEVVGSKPAAPTDKSPEIGAFAFSGSGAVAQRWPN
jgi:hypothetical protein